VFLDGDNVNSATFTVDFFLGVVIYGSSGAECNFGGLAVVLKSKQVVQQLHLLLYVLVSNVANA